MKVLFVAFLALAVGASALPQEYFELENREQRNLVENQIRKAIEDLSQAIRDNNLDPWQINKLSIENSPQPGVDVKLLIDNLNLRGLSNIGITRLNWSTLGSRLRLDLVLPGISFSLGNSLLEVDFHGTKYAGELSGNFVMTGLALTVDLRVNISIISGITIRSVDATLRIQDMRSDMEAVINEEDYSAELNNLMNVRIPRWLQVNQTQIDRVVSDLIKQVGDWMLSQRSITQEEMYNNDIVESIN